MLSGIDPILTGTLLAHLDAMGHSDAVVVADGHFPAARLGARVVETPGLSAPQVLAAIRSVLPLDNAPALSLMRSADGATLEVQHELIAAARAGDDDVTFVERQAFYDLAADAFLIIRTGETRSYGNALLLKGLFAPGSAT
jgi:L-fucose mutarotase